MIRAIRVYQIRDGASRSEQTEMKVMIRLKQIGVKENGEKRGRLERRKNITERKESCSKREYKSVVRSTDGNYPFPITTK